MNKTMIDRNGDDIYFDCAGNLICEETIYDAVLQACARVEQNSNIATRHQYQIIKKNAVEFEFLQLKFKPFYFHDCLRDATKVVNKKLFQLRKKQHLACRG